MVLKVNEFERDLDSADIGRYDTVEFSENSNSQFVYSSMDDLMNNLSDLQRMIESFIHEQKFRLEVLEDYSKGNNWGIRQGQRRIEKNKSDYRIRNNYGGYITSFVTGYLLGKPLTINYDGKEDLNADKEIQAINDNNDLDSLNYELAYDASRYGRAFEMHYRDEDYNDKIVLIDPKEMFSIRSFKVSNELIGAVHLPVFNDMVYPTVYSDDFIYTLKPFALGQYKLVVEDYKPNPYGKVPVVEWFNNRYRIGDFETVIPNIDAYDSAQSDTANYMSDLNDSTLVLNVDSIDAFVENGGMQAVTDSNVVILENGVNAAGGTTQGKADYIYKQYDVSGTEAYKKRLNDDIFRLSNIPDMTDDQFGTQSGIAIQYKLIGLKQIQVIKENYFTKALRRRYELIEAIHDDLNETVIDANKLTFTFHPNLPQDVWTEVEQYINATGEISQETLMELASFTDSQKEKERLENETLTVDMTDEQRSQLLGGAVDEQDEVASVTE